MGVEYRHYVMPKDRGFAPTRAQLNDLIEALRTERWVYGQPQEENAKGDLKVVLSVERWGESGLRYPFSLSGAPDPDAYYEIQLHLASHYIHHASEIIDPVDATSCSCGADSGARTGGGPLLIPGFVSSAQNAGSRLIRRHWRRRSTILGPARNQRSRRRSVSIRARDRLWQVVARQRRPVPVGTRAARTALCSARTAVRGHTRPVLSAAHFAPRERRPDLRARYRGFCGGHHRAAHSARQLAARGEELVGGAEPDEIQDAMVGRHRHRRLRLVLEDACAAMQVGGDDQRGAVDRQVARLQPAPRRRLRPRLARAQAVANPRQPDRASPSAGRS